MWALASGDNLFRGVHREDGEYDAAMHLAQMIAVLGPPEADLIRNQTNSYHCWTTDNANEQGERWTDANTLFGGPFFNAHSGIGSHELGPNIN